jgi:hypothetical protein
LIGVNRSLTGFPAAVADQKSPTNLIWIKCERPKL